MSFPLSVNIHENMKGYNENQIKLRPGKERIPVEIVIYVYKQNDVLFQGK